MRMSDWSSDGCSSDLVQRFAFQYAGRHDFRDQVVDAAGADSLKHFLLIVGRRADMAGHKIGMWVQIMQHGSVVLGFAGGGIHQAVRVRRIFWANLEDPRSEEHTSELQSLMRLSYAVFCLQKQQRSQTRQH